MSTFTCSLCLTNREFSTFITYFRHITLFHQNESEFQISCNLNSKCGVLYRTFSAYKSHVYRHHSSELTTKANSNVLNTVVIDNREQNDKDLNIEMDLIYNDDDYDDELYLSNNPTELDLSKGDTGKLFSNINQENEMTTMFDVKRSYTSFILQLREEFFVPKSTSNAISSYITTLMNHLQGLFEQQAFIYGSDNVLSSSTLNRNVKVVKLETLKDTIEEVSRSIETITKNDYQFVKNCEEYFGYKPPVDIIVSNPNEETEHGYFIPLDKTLFSMLNSQPLLFQVLDNIQQQRTAAEDNDDLMFSIRDGCNGSRIDENSLLIQLYLDDIGITNPLGSKRDQHKMSMMYFELEDIPDQYRSKLDFINLVGICESKILKVEIFITNFMIM